MDLLEQQKRSLQHRKALLQRKETVIDELLKAQYAIDAVLERQAALIAAAADLDKDGSPLSSTGGESDSLPKHVHTTVEPSSARAKLATALPGVISGIFGEESDLEGDVLNENAATRLPLRQSASTEPITEISTFKTPIEPVISDRHNVDIVTELPQQGGPCRRCHNRHSRCDRVRPRCGECIRRDTLCLYDGEEQGPEKDDGDQQSAPRQGQRVRQRRVQDGMVDWTAESPFQTFDNEDDDDYDIKQQQQQQQPKGRKRKVAD